MNQKNLKIRNMLFIAALLSTNSAAFAASDDVPNDQPLDMAQLTWGACSEASGGTYMPPIEPVTTTSGKELGGLLAVLATSAITKGVDLVGSKLKEAGKEKIYTNAAVHNVLNDISVGCLTFKKGTDYSFRISMSPNDKKTVISPKLVAYKYNKSISGSKSGKRGVVLQIEFTRPGVTDVVKQTVSLGNLKLKTQNNSLSQEIPLMPNPFIVTTDAGVKPAYPFTVSVTMTETKDANTLLAFIADVAEDSNDKTTEILIKAVGATEKPTAPAGGSPTQ